MRLGLHITMIAIAILVAPQIAAGDRVNIFSDPDYKDCFQYDFSVGNNVVYVVHDVWDGAGGVRFRISSGGGFNAILVSETIEYDHEETFYHEGNTQDGVEVIYLMAFECYYHDFLIATLTYYEDGTSLPCSYLEATAHPDAPSGMVESRKCPDMEWIPGPPSNRFNVNQAHWTPEYPGCPTWCGTTPTERSTWGAIKTLFE